MLFRYFYFSVVLILGLSCSAKSVEAQSYLMNNGTIFTCGGTFYDSGGPNGRYGNFESYTYTICSDGSNGEYVQVYFPDGFEIRNSDRLVVYDGLSSDDNEIFNDEDLPSGTPVRLQASSNNPSGCLTFVFRSDFFNRQDGWAGEISCYTDCQPIVADIVSSDPPLEPADTGWINLCPGQELTVKGSATFPENDFNYHQSLETSTFNWFFGDGDMASGDSATHVYDEAGAYILLLVVTDSMGCQSRNFIQKRVRVSPPPTIELNQDAVPPVCAGDTIQLSASLDGLNSGAVLSYEPNTVEFQAGGLRSDSLPLPDGDGRSYEASIDIDQFAPGDLVRTPDDVVKICVNMEHSWMHDLEIMLTCPTNRSIVLQEQLQISQEIFLGTPYELDDNSNPEVPIQGEGMNYCWTPMATNGNWNDYTDNNSASPLPEGDYSPFNDFSELVGCPLNGQWTLTVTDLWASDNGWLFDWSVEFNSEHIEFYEVFTPVVADYGWETTPTTTFNMDTEMEAVANDPGIYTYTFRYEDEVGCTQMTDVDVLVAPELPPNVQCAASDIDFISWEWGSLGEGIEYLVRPVINGVASAWQGPISDTTFTVDNLTNYQSITLEVKVSVDESLLNCQIQVGSITCSNEDCQPGSPKAIDLVDILTEQPSCPGGNTGTATILVEGGEGNYTYLWEDNLMQIDSTAILLEAGTYNLRIEDSGGCFLDTMVIISDPDSLVLSADVTDASCRGEASGQVSLSATGGSGNYTFLWPDDRTDVQRDSLAAGEYTILFEDDNECPGQGTFQIEEPSTGIELTLEQSEAGCYGTSGNAVMAIPSGGTGNAYTYEWSNGQTTPTAVGLDSTPVSVTVKDASGCSISRTFSPQDLDSISIEVILSTPTCNGEQDGGLGVNVVRGGAGNGELSNYYYEWSNGQNTPVIDNLPGGTEYTVTVTDSQGCKAEFTRFLQQPSPILFSTDVEAALCNGESTGAATIENITGDYPTYSIQWDSQTGNQQGQTAENLMAGNYTAVITDAVGCTVEAEVMVEEPPALNLSFITKDVICAGGREGKISAVVTGGSGSITYQWVDGSTSHTREGLPAGSYAVTVQDINGCSIVDTAVITQPQDLTAAATPQGLSCFGKKDGQITVSIEGGSPPYQYSVDNRFFTSDPTITGLEAGVYTVYVRDDGNCTFELSATVEEPLPLDVSAGDHTIRVELGDSLTLIAMSENAQGDMEFVWSAPDKDVLSCTECTEVVINTQHTLSIELYGIDENGCEATDRILYIVDKPRTAIVPSGFTPNGDGQNDLLMVHGKSSTQVMEFKVYNRWGEEVYASSGEFMANDMVGWDGNFKNMPAPPGVYVWYVKVMYEDGHEDTVHGQTTLIR